MCLIPDKQATEEFVATHKEPFKAYKLLQLYTWQTTGCLVSMFMGTKVDPGVMQGHDGFNEPVKPRYHNFEKPLLPKLKYGIHVCLTLEEAHNILYANNNDDYYDINVIVEVECDPQHLVAVGRWDSYGSVDNPPDEIYPDQAIFSQITITKEAHAAALQEAINQHDVALRKKVRTETLP